MKKAKDIKTRSADVEQPPDAPRNYTLDDARRTALQAQAMGVLDPQRPQNYPLARIDHLAAIQACAWRDRALLVGIDVGGTAITLDEIDQLGWRVAFLRWVAGEWRRLSQETDVVEAGDVVSNRDPATLTLQELRDEQRAIHRKLLRAFDLRFAGNAAGRRWVKQVRLNDGDQDIVDDNVQILRMCASDEHRAWLAALPMGEAAAATRLALLEQEFLRRRAHPEVTGVETLDLRALRDQSWTLAFRPAERIRLAGRYRFATDPIRGKDYLGFKQPRKPKKKD